MNSKHFILLLAVIIFSLTIGQGIRADGKERSVDEWYLEFPGWVVSDFTIDSNDNVYLLLNESPIFYSQETEIRKYDKNGNFLYKFGKETLAEWTDPKQNEMNEPNIIHVDPYGNIYVNRRESNHAYGGIQIFDNNGNYKKTLKTPGGITDIFVNNDGITYFSTKYEVHVIDNDGKELRSFGGRCTIPPDEVEMNLEYLRKYDFKVEGYDALVECGLNDPNQKNFENFGEGKFNSIVGLAVDSKSNIFVVDGGFENIQKYDKNGSFLKKWKPVWRNGGSGNSLSSFTIDKNDMLYIATTQGIQLFDTNGDFLSSFGTACGFLFENYPGQKICQRVDEEGQRERNFGMYEDFARRIKINSESIVHVYDNDHRKIVKYYLNSEGVSDNDKSIKTENTQDDLADSASSATTKGGCLIATATFGSELAPQVQLLRELRDNAVLGTDTGTLFMAAFNQFYYSFSPTIADWERQNPVFKELVKTAITPMLSTLSILNYVDIDSDQEMLGYGIGIILLNVGIYFVVPALVLIKLRRIDHD